MSDRALSANGGSATPIKAVVVTRGRTGSSAITDELGKAPGCWRAQELFSQSITESGYLQFGPWADAHPLRERLSASALVSAYLQTLEGHVRQLGAEAMFWKALRHHFDEAPSLAAHLLGFGYRAVYLKRGAARQTISGLIAKARWKFNSREPYSDDKRYEIDLDEFAWHVEFATHSHQEDRAFLRDRGFDFIEVDYERWLADRNGFFGEIYAFLGLPAYTPAPTNYQVMIPDLRATIANYDEVARVAEELGDPIDTRDAAGRAA